MCNADPAFISRRFGAFGDYLRRENVMKKRALFIIALSILAIATMFISGIVAQIIINSRAWQAAGSNYSAPPSLPVIQLEAIIKALLTFPEGLMAIGTVLGAVVLLCVFGLRLGWGKRGTSDQDRNLTISYDGTYGTAGFMTEQEAGACFTVGSPRQTCEDILGMLSDGSVFSLPSDTRLNHNIAVYGASGTGKSRSMSRNSILQAVCRGDSIVVTDPKSELYESMSEYLRNQGYTVKVLNLIQLEHSDSWNCLAEVKDELMAQTFADVVLRATSGEESDAFWYNAELNLLKALVLFVAFELPAGERTFGSVYDMLVNENDRSLQHKMDNIRKEHTNLKTGERMPPSPAYAPFAIFMQSSETVRSSVIIGLGSKLQVLQSKQVRNITNYTDIDLELPGKQKCAYFCIISDQDSTFEFISSLFFSFLFIKLVRYADNYTLTGCLSPQVEFILDEFPNSCIIPDMQKKINTTRSRGLRISIYFQNVGQMKNRYPDDEWQEIIGACDSQVFLGCTDVLTAEYISSRTGEATVEVEGTMRELNTMHITNYTPRFRRTNSIGKRMLMTPDEVLRMRPDEELVFVRGQKVLQAHRFDYSQHPEYRKLHSTKAILHEPDWKTSRAFSCPEFHNDSPESGGAQPDQRETKPTPQATGLPEPTRKAVDINEVL